MSALAKQAVGSKRMSEWSEQTGERVAKSVFLAVLDQSETSVEKQRESKL